jgi:hypothetical protein
VGGARETHWWVLYVWRRLVWLTVKAGQPALNARQWRVVISLDICSARKITGFAVDLVKAIEQASLH